MEISGSWSYRRALVLSVERMRELNSILLSFCERIEFTATTKKNQDIQFTTLDEMLSFDNFKERRLQEIEMTGYKGYHRIFNIKIKDTNGIILHYYKTVECFYHLDTFDDETLFLSKIKYVLKKSTPNYWLLGKFSLYGTVWIASVISTVINCLTKNMPNLKINLLVVFCIVIICALLLIIWVFDHKFYYNIFPAVSFLWEEEIARYDKWIKLRSNIFWGVLVSLIVGLFGAMIIKAFLR